MIKLDVADYCRDCPDFEPQAQGEVTTLTQFNYGVSTDFITKCNTVVQCKYRYRCAAIHNYMKGLEKDGN